MTAESIIGPKPPVLPGVAMWLMRELYATRPLWRQPIELDNTRLVRFIGNEPHTPLQTAVESTLRGMNCLREEELGAWKPLRQA